METKTIKLGGTTITLVSDVEFPKGVIMFVPRGRRHAEESLEELTKRSVFIRGLKGN